MFGTFLSTAFFLLLIASIAHAETVAVKDRGPVDLTPFFCTDVTSSYQVNRLCYDQSNNYMLVRVRGAFHQYCGVGSDIADALMFASSVGPFYRAYIKDRYDCRPDSTPP